ncbi:MAG: carbon storage regulator [Gemmataceae bacterium]
MLVLTRKLNESIVINDDTVITVLEIVGSKVRLGIKAPATVPVWRKELVDARQEWQRKDAGSEIKPDHLVEAGR